MLEVLNLIIHYEMGNTTLIDSILRSTSRYLNKQNEEFVIEKKILSFFSKINRQALTKKELKKSFSQLKYELENELTTVTEKRILTIFDIISWIDSKLLEKPFGQIVKEKFEQRNLMK